MSAGAFPNEDDNHLYAAPRIQCGIGGRFNTNQTYHVHSSTSTHNIIIKLLMRLPKIDIVGVHHPII